MFLNKNKKIKSRSLFISDLHLCNSKPKLTESFFYFLKNEVFYSDALYILGDFFKSWIGNDDEIHFHNLIASALLNLKKRGVSCYLIRGNRDFLINDQFAYLSGISFLPEEFVIEIYGKKILILHGDTLCTNDIKYQYLRKKINTRWIQKFFLFLPIYIRKKIIFYMQIKKNNLSSFIKNDLSININTVINAFKKYNVKFMIHGHTHKILKHEFKINNLKVQRLVLSNWKKKGSVIQVDRKKIILKSFFL